MSWQVSFPKTYPFLTPMTDVNHTPGQPRAAGTFGERSPQVGVWEVQEETSVFQCRDVPGAHPAALTLSQGKKETCSRFIQQEALKLRI